MLSFPDRKQQIRAVHGPFIRQVVELSLTPERRKELEPLFSVAIENGWGTLVDALRRVADGQRDATVLNGLDEEDRLIAESVLEGLQDPTSLPREETAAQPAMAAPGIAGMVHAAATGNIQALRLISDMAEQMSRAGGDMARLAAIIRPLINGERDADKLLRGFSAQGEQLVLNILSELSQSDVH